MSDASDRDIQGLTEAFGRATTAVGVLTQEVRVSAAGQQDQIRGLEERVHFFQKLVMFLIGLSIMGGLAVIGQVAISLLNRSTVTLIKDVIDPGGARYNRTREDSGRLLVSLAIEQDCRQRRALADLPAPPLGTECARLPDNPPGAPAPLPPSPAPSPAPPRKGDGATGIVLAGTAAAVVVAGLGLGYAYSRHKRKEGHEQVDP